MNRWFRVLKWSLTAIWLALAAVSVVSLRTAISRVSRDNRHELSFYHGATGLAWRPDGWTIEEKKYVVTPGWSTAEYGVPTLRPHWWPRLDLRSRAWHGVEVPNWIPLLLIGGVTGFLWYRDRRATRGFIREVMRRLTPDRPQRVSVGLALVFCPIHVVGITIGVLGVWEGYYLFLSPTFDQTGVVYGLLMSLSFVFFWGTPVFAFVWAMLWVRFRNRLLERTGVRHCDHCRYNLTGNVSGICPECGQAVALDHPGDAAGGGC